MFVRVSEERLEERGCYPESQSWFILHCDMTNLSSINRSDPLSHFLHVSDQVDNFSFINFDNFDSYNFTPYFHVERNITDLGSKEIMTKKFLRIPSLNRFLWKETLNFFWMFGTYRGLWSVWYEGHIQCCCLHYHDPQWVVRIIFYLL